MLNFTMFFSVWHALFAFGAHRRHKKTVNLTRFLNTTCTQWRKRDSMHIKNFNFTTGLEVPHALSHSGLLSTNTQLSHPQQKNIKSSPFQQPSSNSNRWSASYCEGWWSASYCKSSWSAIPHHQDHHFWDHIWQPSFERTLHPSFQKKQLQSRHKFHRQLLTMSHNSSQQKPPPLPPLTKENSPSKTHLVQNIHAWSPTACRQLSSRSEEFNQNSGKLTWLARNSPMFL